MKFRNFDTNRLRGIKVAALAADGFEYVELSVPKRALRLAGARVDVISLHSGRIRGMNLTEPARTLRVDRTLDQADPDDYDALLIPGGFIGPDFLRQSGRARDFVRVFDAAAKPIATLCHGPWLLASCELVAGRTLASWPGIRDDLVHAGATWRDEPVVRDRNWVTSRGPQDLLAFIPAMVALFAERAPLAATKEVSVVTSDITGSSPQADEPPRIAVGAARVLPGPTLRTMGAFAAVTALGALVMRRAG